jgi:hypothetical protein
VEICEGQGWRLVVDPGRAPYIALIGGEGWASELTSDELHALRRGVQLLMAQHRAMADGLMAEEAIDLEYELPIGDGDGAEGGSLWLGLRGDRRQGCLQLVLTPGSGSRAIEGAWSTDASGAFAAALEGLRLAEHDQGDQDC